MRPVMLDLDVHKAIEARRRSFEETPNDILRRALGVSAPISTRPDEIVPKLRRSRHRADYRVSFAGHTFEVASLKAGLKAALLAAEEEQPGFLERLFRFRSGTSRRIVATRPHDLYPKSPQLIQDHAEKLMAGWWYDTNVSRDQCSAYFREIARVTGLEAPKFTA